MDSLPDWVVYLTDKVFASLWRALQLTVMALVILWIVCTVLGPFGIGPRRTFDADWRGATKNIQQDIAKWAGSWPQTLERFINKRWEQSQVASEAQAIESAKPTVEDK